MFRAAGFGVFSHCLHHWEGGYPTVPPYRRSYLPCPFVVDEIARVLVLFIENLFLLPARPIIDAFKYASHAS